MALEVGKRVEVERVLAEKRRKLAARVDAHDRDGKALIQARAELDVLRVEHAALREKLLASVEPEPRDGEGS